MEGGERQRSGLYKGSNRIELSRVESELKEPGGEREKWPNCESNVARETNDTWAMFKAKKILLRIN